MKKVRIAAIQAPYQKVEIEKPVNFEKNLQWTIERIRLVAAYHAQIICLSEMFTLAGRDEKPAAIAEPLSGPTVQTMVKLARELKVAILCPLYEHRKGKIYNTVVVINKSGKIVGQYDKIHPTEGEIDEGVVPGKTAPGIFNLDGIKIGFQVCFDANWPQDWLNVKQAGAEIIFFCSAFSAGELLPAYSATLSVPVIAATWCRHCRIYDRLGNQIAHQSPYYDFALADILVKQPILHLDYQVELLDKIRRENPAISTHVLDGKGTWTMFGAEPDVLQKIIDKYKLVDIDDYLTRAKKRQDKARK